MNSAVSRLAALLLFGASLAHPHASAADLAGHPTWLKLIHYEPHGRAESDLLSATLTDSFFLAGDGRTNPESELRATLAALAIPLQGDPNEHAQCQFPARYIWLKRQSALDGVEDIRCPDFDSWIFGDATDSLSIVFVTGYLGNPASYYGHTLLKFNSSASRGTSDLLDVTVNYGAIIPPGTGPVTYIYNGATGGFNAGFSHIKYYFHDHNYGEIELRDLWEYELNLTPDEVHFVVAHAREVLGREFTYYFFRKNCAYRMAEIIEIVDGIEIIPRRRGWTIPQSIIRLAAGTEHHGKSLLGNVTHYPSRQSIFYEKFRQLDGLTRDTMQEVVRSPDEQTVDTLLGRLGEDDQQRVIDTLLDYYQYRMPEDEPSDSALASRYRSLLTRRFHLPRTQQTPVPPPSHGPDDDRAPGYLSLGPIHNDIFGNGALFRVRAAYYDPLDSSASHVPHSELSMGDVTIAAGDEGVSLRRASLFRVEAVNGSISGLPGDNGRSWTLGLGLVERNAACNNCMVTRFEGDMGRSFPLGDFSTAGLYFGGALQNDRSDGGYLFTRLTAFVNLTLGSRFRMRARYENRYHIDGRLRFEDVASLEGRFELSRNWDARLRLEKNVATAASLSLGYYW